MPTPSLKSLEKALRLLGRLAAPGDCRSIPALACELSMPLSTAHRICVTFERAGYITRVRRGHYLPGPTLLGLAAPGALNHVLAAVGRPIIKALAQKTGCTSHLGVFENGMVTYLIKTGRRRSSVFTKEGTQLEAYCTGIGKVLLASLPKSELDEYLQQGPFIPLTSNTLTQPRSLRAALSTVRAQGYATDRSEMDTNLNCLAVPVCDGSRRILAALSISERPGANEDNLLAHLETLRIAAATIAGFFPTTTTERNLTALPPSSHMT